jgi:EmrB/QacA subfamily drug resistance transporter
MRSDSLRWWILLTVIIGTFLGRLDQTIVNLALPKIMSDFSINFSEAGWIATAYILANAVFVPVWGKLGDTIGRKKVYILGFTIFILGSVLAGLAWDLPSMIVFRVIQAIAGSADYPTAMAILAVTFRQGKERAEALGLWSASFAAASVFGPLLGGPLIDTFGWRSVFLINLPVGLLGLGMAMVFVRESVSERPTVNFDWWGAITLGICLSSLVLVLDKGVEWGWLSTPSILSYLTCASFAYIFYRIDTTHPEPIVDFKFFKIGAYTATLVNNFIVFMGMMGGIFLIPIFAQTYLGYDSTQTGYLFMPMAAMLMIAAPLGTRMIGRVEPRFVIAASTLVAGVGMLLFTGLDPRSGPFDIIIPVSIMAFGLGFGMAQRTNIIASAVPDEEMGIASSTLALARNIAGAFGIALFATILNSAIEDNVLSASRFSTIGSASPLVFQESAALMILKAQISAYREVFVIAAALLIIGSFLALFIHVKEKKSGAEVFID